MILLNEKEVVTEASKDKEYCQLAVDVGMWAAREQLEKVVEWLDRPCHEHSGDVLHPHRRCGACLQALKKEAGI